MPIWHYFCKPLPFRTKSHPHSDKTSTLAALSNAEFLKHQTVLELLAKEHSSPSIVVLGLLAKRLFMFFPMLNLKQCVTSSDDMDAYDLQQSNNRIFEGTLSCF